LKAQKDTIDLVLGRKNIEDVQQGFDWIVNEGDSEEIVEPSNHINDEL